MIQVLLKISDQWLVYHKHGIGNVNEHDKHCISEAQRYFANSPIKLHVMPRIGEFINIFDFLNDSTINPTFIDNKSLMRIKSYEYELALVTKIIHGSKTTTIHI